MPAAEQLLLAEAVLCHRPWPWPSVTRPCYGRDAAGGCLSVSPA